MRDDGDEAGSEAGSAPEDGEPTRDQYALLGARLQDLRRRRGLSLTEVAAAVGVSRSFLSMVERGTTDLALGRFTRLAQFYRVAPGDLLLDMAVGEDAPVLGTIDAQRSVARGDGVDYRVLVDENPVLIWVKLQPGARFDDLVSHRGDDYWAALQGAARLHYGAHDYDLLEGTTARFSGTVPHGLSNPFRKTCALIAICTVPYW